MNVEQALFQFIDFYLQPTQSQKSIELLKVKLTRQTENISDPFHREVSQIRNALQLLSHRRKPTGQILIAETPPEKLYLETLRLKPRDCLILISNEIFQIPEQHLSLALQVSVENLNFRRRQLNQQIEEEGFQLTQLKSILASNAQTPSPIKIAEPRRENLTLWQNFQRLPLALRFTIETGAILMGLLGLLWLIPEIRNRYENSIQKRINDYLIESSLVDAPPPEGTTKTGKLPTPSVEDAEEEEAPIAGLNKSSSDELSSRKQPKVNEGETWRFSFTGAGTADIEAGVSDALRKLNISSEKPLTVPGGIQFNFMLALDKVIPLKNALEQTVNDLQQKSKSQNSAQNSASFSWYKKRSMITNTRKIPSGHVLIIIWISTL